ncbi:hypothetical protein EON65_23915 [archaeon]|nr:MAG: hypothetical protein EON65_23915 [archaeon]
MLIAISIVVVLEVDDFNSVIDVLVSVYSVVSLTLFIVAGLNIKSNKELDIDDRKFVYKKANRLENLTWKQKFFGSFEKYERTGMAEVSYSCTK